MSGERPRDHAACDNAGTKDGPGGARNANPVLTPEGTRRLLVNDAPQVCELPDCDRPRYQKRRMCSSHTMRKHRYGDPYWTPPVRSADLAGRQFGRLRALRRHDPNHWVCRCECGIETVVRTWSLTSGGTTSCGRHSRREDVGYSAVHCRLRIDRGPAADHLCVDCGNTAAQWSYSHEDPDERLGSEGSYSLDLDHYAPRCVPCHKVFDLAVIEARAV